MNNYYSEKNLKNESYEILTRGIICKISCSIFEISSNIDLWSRNEVVRAGVSKRERAPPSC